MTDLRPYQLAAVDAVYRSLAEQDGNPAVCLPTGSGKTWVLARICADVALQWNGRVVVLAHVAELLKQNAEKIQLLMHGLGVGIYSSGLRKRDTDTAVVVAGIKSVYQKACDLGRFDLILIDECHLLGEDADSMYQRFLADMRVINPTVRIVGFTATPFRMKAGFIYGPDRIFSHLCYEIGVKELIRDGYLSPLISKAAKAKVNTAGLHVRGGEFVADEVERLMDDGALVDAACAEIVALTATRRATIIFAAGVTHAEHVASVLRECHGCAVGTVFGSTPDGQRTNTIARFRDGGLRYLVNVAVLTTGFDVPHVDCVVMLRPTLSPGLYAQCVGRGFRLAPGKTDCLVLDFGGNVLRHGPVDALKIKDLSVPNGGEAPAKECPQCQVVIAAGFATCPQCGFVFPPPEREQHEREASAAGVLSGQVTITEHAVRDVFYAVHQKRGAAPDAPKTLRVEYEVGFNQIHKEWVCFEHVGFARGKAEAWWRERCDLPVPSTAVEACRLALAGALAQTTHVTVRTVAGEDFERISEHQLGAKPVSREPGDDRSEPAFASISNPAFDDAEPPF